MSVALSMVLLRAEVAVPAARIEQELRTRYPDLNASGPADEKSTASLQLPNGHLIVALMPAPIPWSDLEGPCATSLLWKNAAEEVKPHCAHLIVTVLSELDEIERSILLTQATVAVLAASGAAVGVYWGSAALLVPKDFFVEYAQQIMPLGPPLDLWIGQDATEKVRAVYAPSTFGQNTRVMQLRYESPPAKPWWKIW